MSLRKTKLKLQLKKPRDWKQINMREFGGWWKYSVPRLWLHFCCSVWENIIATHLPIQLVKTLPAVQETWVWSLSQEDPLEKGKASHSNILAWRISWTEDPGGLQSRESQELDITEWLNHHPYTYPGLVHWNQIMHFLLQYNEREKAKQEKSRQRYIQHVREEKTPVGSEHISHYGSRKLKQRWASFHSLRWSG